MLLLSAVLIAIATGPALPGGCAGHDAHLGHVLLWKQLGCDVCTFAVPALPTAPLRGLHALLTHQAIMGKCLSGLQLVQPLCSLCVTRKLT